MSPRNRISWPFRAILSLLPRHLRSEHEDELAQFLALDAPPGAMGRVRYWFATLSDVFRASPAAHLDILRQDLVLALRQLRRAPGYAVIAVLTLATGIAGNAALFTLVDHVLLQPPPFVGADRLVTLSEEHRERGLLRFGMSPANFRDFMAGAVDLVESATVWQPRSGTVLIGDRPDRVAYSAVSGEFFRVFRESAALGRALAPGDDVPGSTAAVVSHAFWTSRMGSDPGAVGRSLSVNGAVHRVVGVMPAGFSYPGEATMIWTPLGLPESEWSRRGARFLGTTVRLKEGVGPAHLAERTAATAIALSERFPETNDGWSTSALTLQEAATQSVRAPLLIVWCAAGLILLIAVANVANLLLGRAVARREEMSLRRALGARAGRLVRQTLTEGAVLATLGALFGLVVAALLLWGLRGASFEALPRAAGIGLDARAIGFTALLALTITLMFSVVPAVIERGRRGLISLRARGSGRSIERARVQRVLVISEVALAVVVAVGTGLLARSASRLLHQPLGYDPEGTTTFRIEPPMRIDPNQPFPELIEAITQDRARVAVTYDAFMNRLLAEPSVAAAGAVSRLPLTGEWWLTGFDMPGTTAGEDDYVAYIRVILPGYLQAMGTRLLQGRDLQRTDVASSERVVMIDQAFADRYFSARDPVGETILLDGPPGEDALTARIVGVTETIRQASLESVPRPTFYMAFSQALEGHASNWGMDVVIRSRVGDASAEMIRSAALDFFPDAAVFRVQRMSDLVSASFAGRRLQLLLFGAFAGLALTLTLVGVFGVLALHVRERAREFGIRVAVGATPWRIRWTVERDALSYVGWGSTIGLTIAAIGGRAFESLVYGISVYDPIAFIGGPVALAVVALAGGLLPAWTATRSDPARVLRSDG